MEGGCAWWGLLDSLEWGCAGSCPLSGRRNGGLNHRRRIGEPQIHAINKICAARGPAERHLGLISWELLAHPGSPQPGRAGLPLQQEGFKHSTAGRCLGAWWDSRCSRSVHMCSHASVSTGSLLKCCRAAAVVAEGKKSVCSEVCEIRRDQGWCRSEISVCPCLGRSWLCPNLCWLFYRWP